MAGQFRAAAKNAPGAEVPAAVGKTPLPDRRIGEAGGIFRIS
jgi:hypothetical protein